MRNIIKVALAVSAISMSTVCASAEMKTASQIYFDGLARHEKAMVANATARCAGMVTVQQAVVTRDAPQSPALAAMSTTKETLVSAMLATNYMIAEQRGATRPASAYVEDAQGQIEAHTTFYLERMQKNQISTGEMFGQDNLIIQDMEFCGQLLPTLLDNEYWLAVLENNDWTFFDDKILKAH